MVHQNGWISFILFICFLILTDFLSGIQYILNDTTILLEQIIRPNFELSRLDVQKQLVIFHTYETKAKDSDIETTLTKPNTEIKQNQKKIYIYNSHQNEMYKDDKSVVDASIYLATLLEKEGFKVIVELNDFNQYAKKNGYSYDELYDVSAIYLNKAISEYNGFDYVIDLHRDGVGNANTSVVVNDISYAKMMFVVSLAGKYNETQYAYAKQISKLGNQKVNGIFKNITKKYYTIFNQDVTENLYLIEMGSNNNTFEEVKQSLQVFTEIFTKEVQS